MAVATYSDYAAPKAGEKTDGIFSRIVNAIVRARSREAERLIAFHLLVLEDEDLAKAGFTREELQRKNPAPSHY